MRLDAKIRILPKYTFGKVSFEGEIGLSLDGHIVAEFSFRHWLVHERLKVEVQQKSGLAPESLVISPFGERYLTVEERVVCDQLCHMIVYGIGMWYKSLEVLLESQAELEDFGFLGNIAKYSNYTSLTIRLFPVPSLGTLPEVIEKVCGGYGLPVTETLDLSQFFNEEQKSCFFNFLLKGRSKF